LPPCSKTAPTFFASRCKKLAGNELVIQRRKISLEQIVALPRQVEVATALTPPSFAVECAAGGLRQSASAAAFCYVRYWDLCRMLAVQCH